MTAGDEASLPDSGPGSKRRRRTFLGVSAVLVLATLITFRAVLMPFLLAVVLAYVLSPLVQMGERLKLGKHTAPRWVVVLSIYVALLGLLTGLVSATVPRLAGEVARLAREAPAAVQTFRDEWLPQFEQRLRGATAAYLDSGDPVAELPLEAAPVDPATAEAPEDGESGQVPDPDLTPWQQRKKDAADPTAIRVVPRPSGGFNVILPAEGVRVVEDDKGGYRIEASSQEEHSDTDITAAITESLAGNLENTERVALTVLTGAQKFIGALTRGLFGFVMTLMLSAFMLITSERIFGFFRSLYKPTKRHQFDDLLRRLDRGLAGVVRGQLMICGINGVLTGIGLYAMGIKYWTFLTLLATVMSLIPIFGSILSTIPAVAIALPEGWGLAAGVLLYIVLIHQLEANVLNPKIMGDSARVHPVLIVFALLAGEHVAGITGALLAVPVLSITQTLFLFLRELSLGVPRTGSVAATSTSTGNPSTDTAGKEHSEAPRATGAEEPSSP